MPQLWKEAQSLINKNKKKKERKKAPCNLADTWGDLQKCSEASSLRRVGEGTRGVRRPAAQWPSQTSKGPGLSSSAGKQHGEEAINSLGGRRVSCPMRGEQEPGNVEEQEQGQEEGETQTQTNRQPPRTLSDPRSGLGRKSVGASATLQT